VGFLPVFFPPERSLGHATVHAQPGPVDALPVIVGQQTPLPHVAEDTGSDPFLKAIMRGGAGTEAGGVERLPLTAGPEHEEDGLHADAVGGAWSAAAEAMGVFVDRKQHLDGLPEILGDMPLVHYGHIHKTDCFHGCTSCVQLPRINVSCTQLL
jgi:hypothetical protein